MADQVALVAELPLVDACSGTTINAWFRDRATSTASTPSTIRYRVDCLTNGRNVINWTSVSAANSAVFEIPGTRNGIIANGNDYETRQLMVELDTGLSTQVRNATTWKVKNNRTFEPMVDFDDALLLEPYFPITAAETAASVEPTAYIYQAGDVRRYGAALDGTTDDAQALQDAINSNAEVFGIFGTLAVASQVELKSNLTIKGEGYHTSKIKATANTFSALSDNAVGLSNILIKDLGMEASSVGSSNRCIWLDADTGDVSTNITIERCRFTAVFRAVEIDRGINVKVRDCTFQDLGGIGVYVGESVAKGYSEKVSVTGCTFNDNGGADIEGGVIVAYADEVDISNNHFESVGATSGATNLYHATYLRTCTHGVFNNNTYKTIRGGAAIHVFSDVGAGEVTNKHITISGNVITDCTTYNGIRCDQVEGLTVTGNTVKDCFSNGMYLTDISGLTVTGNVLHNNNDEEASGMLAACAIRLQDIVDGSITGNVARETEASAAEYGQGGFVRVEGTNTDLVISGNTFTFSGASNGYYFCEVSGTLDRTCFTGNIQRGASAFLNESGTVTDASFFGNVISGNGGTFLTLAQYHKFSARGNFNQGAPEVYESDGTYVTARLSAAPVAGDWIQGDIVWRTTPGAGFEPGYVCTTSGTPGTWKAMAILAA